MKLQPPRIPYISIVLFVVSFSALALGVITMTGPVLREMNLFEPSVQSAPDTIIKPPQTAPVDTAFGNTLLRAESYFRANKLEACIAEYEIAQKLKPGDKALSSRLVQLRAMLNEYNKKKVDFDVSMASGNTAFLKKDYLNAKAYYQLALNVLPNDSTAKEKLKKTMELIRSQKAQNTLFDVAIASADRLFQAGEYDRAKEEYENASKILPSEQYPKKKINEIIKIKVDMQLDDGLYAEAIKKADAFYNAKNWQPALQEYQGAAKIKPAEKYPRDRIVELTALIDTQRSRDEAYIKLIASADQRFESKSYVLARKDYVSASKLKPEQSYPKNKIAEIDLLLTQGAKTQKDYEQYISFADSFYISKNFLSARDYYTLALGVKPNESYPKEMLEKVKPLVAGQEAGEKAREESYKSAIAVADREFSVQNYDQAKKEYQRASGIKPAEQYPKEKIAAIEKIFADQQQAALLSASARQKALDNEYTGLLAAGEKLFKTKSWDQAKSTYQKALILKPDEALPKQRIASIDSIGASLLAKGKKFEEDYQAAVKRGDSLLGLNSYAEAKTAFTQATNLKPSEKYPKDRLLIINAALSDMSKQQALDKQYLSAIASADKSFAAKSYSDAKVQYTTALALKPGEAYPTSKLAEISTILEGVSKQKALDSEYAALIASGEKLFKAKTWEPAKAEYQKALALKPSEVLPQKRIASIDSIGGAEIARLKKLDDDYTAAVKKGDSLLGKTEYAMAKTSFTEALAFKPAESYPKEKLTIINAALADLSKQQAIDKQYLAAVTSGDKLLAAKSFPEAKAQYNAALTIKPGEAYPKTKIADIDKTLEDIAKQKALDADYTALIASGEKLYKAKTWEQAKSEYQKALAIKPAENLPQKRIASIDSIAEVLMKQKSIEEQYTGIIANADKLLASKTYDQAKTEYQKALAVKPSEVYPRTKIQEIDKQLAELARLKKLDEDYASAIKKGDSLLGKTEYAQAKTVFTEALALKPAETYPKEKLAVINTALADLAKQQALDKQYLVAISSADKLLGAKSYADAKVQYAAASALKPTEAYPKTKIAEIDKALEEIAKQKALEAEYAGLLASGEKLFKAKTWEQAKSEYQKALVLKPAESLPQKRIASIDSIADVLLKQKSLEDQYAGIIANADKLLASKTYEQAKTEYQKALAVKPAEVYPKTKIQEIDKQLAELARLKKLDEDYAAAIKKGDSLLGKTEYTQAKTVFTDASVLKPAENYPKEKLAVINTALADLAKQQALDKQYLAAISSADKLLGAKSYADAKVQFGAASALKPTEAYPKTKIAEIDKTLADIAKQKALDEEYAGLFDSAEKLFKAKTWEQAKSEYKKALALKPAEALPKQRINSIDSIADVLLKQKNLDDRYASIIAGADKLFTAKTYEQAKSEYLKAGALKPTEEYPKTQVREIDKQLAELARIKKLDDDYKLAVKKGDSLLTLKLYALAKPRFAEAGTLKPAEAYPKEKIAQIDKALDDLAKQKELDDRYQSVVTSADKLLAVKSYIEAKTQYTSALTLKPSEAYPKTRIAEIDKTIADSIQKQKAFEAQYAGIIGNADKLLLAKNYTQAKPEYEKALTMKPSEEYPKTKIAEIEKVLADIAVRKARDSAYVAVIAEADKLLLAKSYDEAKSGYQKAFQYKADDLYSKTKIAEIDKAVSDIARQKANLDSRYKASVARADQLLASKSYDQAKAEYLVALGIKAGEQYPQDKLKEIEKILAELKAREDAYKASVAKADQMLLEKKFEDARTEYENALTIKPNDQYAKNKVDEINKKLVELQGKKKTFDDLVLKGDNAFAGRDFGKARESFQQATALFPEEKYPKDRLDRVNSVIDSLYRANKGKYDKSVAEGDKFYNSFEFDKAIDSYSDASAFLPMENYPRDMIARIRRTIAENAIADVLNSAVTIASNEEKKFKFTPVNIASRKDNFIYIKMRNLSGKPFNVLLRYGKDNQPSGGVVIRNLSTDGRVNERLISVREQDVWYRVDNDFISLYPQGGDIEVTFIQVSKAR
ncbi:MAG: hypothetical protein WCO02_10695 [Bacteroidota bacterium]